MTALTAPLATSLVDQVKHALATAGYDMAVRHRKTHKLMRPGFLVREPESGVVLVYHQDFTGNAQDRMTQVAKYADVLPGHGFNFRTAFTPRHVPYIIVSRLV